MDDTDILIEVQLPVEFSREDLLAYNWRKKRLLQITFSDWIKFHHEQLSLIDTLTRRANAFRRHKMLQMTFIRAKVRRKIRLARFKSSVLADTFNELVSSRTFFSRACAFVKSTRSLRQYQLTILSLLGPKGIFVIKSARLHHLDMKEVSQFLDFQFFATQCRRWLDIIKKQIKRKNALSSRTCAIKRDVLFQALFTLKTLAALGPSRRISFAIARRFRNKWGPLTVLRCLSSIHLHRDSCSRRLASFSEKRTTRAKYYALQKLHHFVMLRVADCTRALTLKCRASAAAVTRAFVVLLRTLKRSWMHAGELQKAQDHFEQSPVLRFRRLSAGFGALSYFRDRSRFDTFCYMNAANCDNQVLRRVGMSCLRDFLWRSRSSSDALRRADFAHFLHRTHTAYATLAKIRVDRAQSRRGRIISGSFWKLWRYALALSRWLNVSRARVVRRARIRQSRLQHTTACVAEGVRRLVAYAVDRPQSTALAAPLPPPGVRDIKKMDQVRVQLLVVRAARHWRDFTRRAKDEKVIHTLYRPISSCSGDGGLSQARPQGDHLTKHLKGADRDREPNAIPARGNAPGNLNSTTFLSFLARAPPRPLRVQAPLVPQSFYQSIASSPVAVFPNQQSESNLIVNRRSAQSNTKKAAIAKELAQFLAAFTANTRSSTVSLGRD